MYKRQGKGRAGGRGLKQVYNVNQSVGLAETDYPIVSHSVEGSKIPVELSLIHI